MKIFTICMFVFVFGAAANGYSQKQLVTLDIAQCDVNTLFQEIWKQTGLRFVYNNKHVSDLPRFDVKSDKKTVEEVLAEIFEKTTLQCVFESDVIFVLPKDLSQQRGEQPRKITVRGKVVDVSGQPVPGVTILLRVPGALTTPLGTSTNTSGEYELSWPEQEGVSLIFTFIGMVSQEIKYTGQSQINVTLEEEISEMDEVVVTGYFERTRNSFTGAEVSIKGEELRKVGTLNILQAISIFDPSVRTVPNNEWGSDPNRVPELTVRGENGFDLRGSADDAQSNPNAPLYVLDGIEVTPQTIYDFPKHRVESITILKDASATSLYGSRGANGVIVVNSIHPKEGEIRLSFNADFNISIPDLRDYNLMDSEEKLEFERLAGVYTSSTNSKEEQMGMDILYNERLSEVRRGVDTYWLSQPLNTSVNQRYNLFIEGGSQQFRYGVDLRYDTDKGVMKGSGREKYGIKNTFNYRVDNKLIVHNEMSYDDVRGDNSPYGSFANFARQNPYERIYDPETGEMVRRFTSNNEKNPLLDAHLPNINLERYSEFKDNLRVDWRVNPHLRIVGRGALTKTISRSELYRSPESSEFDTETDVNKKGSYTITNSTEIKFDGNLTISYSNLLFERFTTSIGLGSNLVTTSLDGEGFTAVGFLSDNMNYIQYAQMFKENSTPTGKYDRSRLIGFFGSANIGYQDRYFLEASFRTDGSSRFGRKSRFAPFWSVGAAWNLHKESFWAGSGYMKIRASVGSTGSVNFSADQAITKYAYNSGSGYNGVYGAQLIGYGNPSLKWQNTLQYNAGLDMSVWRNILVLNVDAYLKRTENLLLDIDVAPSTGFGSYRENMGSMDNKGVDVRLRANLISNSQQNLFWSVTAGLSHNTNVIRKLSNALEAMNQEALSLEASSGNTPLRLYEEGRSQSALMVVPSMGIDPRTGNEVFVKLNGDLTFDYDPKDKVIVGDKNPKIQGNIQTNFYYKGFNVFAAFQYEHGAKTYNQTLANKVEGANPLHNADKRVLYDRWKQPGDIAMFRRINDQSSVYQSSRLVQKDNFINLSSLSLSYDIPMEKLKKIFMERCVITFTATDVFRIATIKQERGTSYPFAHTFSLGLNVTL